MKTKIIAILVFASLMTKLNAQNHDKVGLLEKPVPVSSVRNITGFFGHRMEVNRNAYLKNRLRYKAGHYFASRTYLHAHGY